MLRDLIEIDEEQCIGCGSCVPNCHQGALQIIDGKVRLLSDLMCEGLGACVGHCPTGAMKISKQEAAPYDEALVMDKMIKAGTNTLKAHLEHLVQHKQDAYFAQALGILKERGIENPMEKTTNTGASPMAHHGCPSQSIHVFHKNKQPGHSNQDQGLAPECAAPQSAVPQSQLGQWPVQLHLVSPGAPYFEGADLLLASDCSAFSHGNFHQRFLKGKALAIACPKLDPGQDGYVNKLTAMIDHAGLNTITVLIMEVPCCRGLLAIAQQSLAQAQRKIPIKAVVLSLQGEVKQEVWV